MPAPPLRDLRVLDVTGPEAAACGKILADLGADVVKVTRPDQEEDLEWLAWTPGCRSVALDPERPADRPGLDRLIAAADVLLESFPPGHLDDLGWGWPALHARHPRLVLTSITPFGQDGPRRGWRGPELVLQAMSGMMHQLGDPDRPPVRIRGRQAWLHAAGQAAVATLLALAALERTGRGQWVDVSAQVAMLWTLMSGSGMPALHGWDPFRDGGHTRFAGFRRRMIFPCRDGRVTLILSGGAVGGPMMEALTRWMDQEGMAPRSMRERDWRAWDTAHLVAAGEGGQAEIDEVAAAIAAFTAGKSKAECYRAALERGLLLAPVADIADVLADPQLAARGFWVPVPDPRLGRHVLYPGPFALLSATPVAAPRPAPRPGEHTAEVHAGWRPRPPGSPRAPREAALSFQGLRVVDFSWVATAPITGRLLAEFGADVVRVESARRMDPGRTIPPWADGRAGPDRSQLFANYNAGKRSVCLDLAHPEGRALARRLVLGADVVIESFRPGTMARWGLDWASLCGERPDLVYLSSSQQGQTGPHRDYGGYGSLAAALAGFYAVTGWPDREPALIYGAYTDFVAHHFASAALLAALHHRRRTGQGQHIDCSQLEASLHFLAPEILEQTVLGQRPGRRGNAHPRWAPHGVYPCAGADRWCAIACESEADWQALRRAMGEPAWAAGARFATAAARKRHEAELDRLISGWTRARDAAALMEACQAAGAPAGMVQSCADLHRDPGLAARGAFRWLEHPEMGRAPYEAWPFTLSATPPRSARAPLLGEHTAEVLAGLGLGADEVHALRARGAIG